MVLLILFPHPPTPASPYIHLLHLLWISTPLTKNTSIAAASFEKLGACVTKADIILI